MLAFTKEQLTANNRFDAKSIFNHYKQQKTLDLFRQFECRQSVVAIVEAIILPETRLEFVSDGLPKMLRAASEQNWKKIEEISDFYSMANDDVFMSNIKKLYAILAISKRVIISLEENQLIAAAILNIDIRLSIPDNGRTKCKLCKRPDDSVVCQKHYCKNCLENPRRSTRNTTTMDNGELMCATCVNNKNSTKRNRIPIGCSICCNKCNDFGKSKQCTDCLNRFHEKCHPNGNASKCQECISGNCYHLNNNNNQVMLTRFVNQKHCWPVVVVSKQQLPKQKSIHLKPGTAIVFSIVKNVYQRVNTSDLLALHLINPMARDAICPPHENGLNDAINIADNIC